MFKNLPESIKYKEDNRKKLFFLAFISILWICSLSTSTVANIMFYDAQLEEKHQFFILTYAPPQPITHASCYDSEKVPNGLQIDWVSRPHIFTGCGFDHSSEIIGLDSYVESELNIPNSKTLSHNEKLIRSIAINQVEAEKPTLAHVAGISGKVVIKILINEEGRVSSAKVISGHPLLQQAALNAAKEWTFKPKVVDGSPVKVESTLTFRFSK